MNGKEKNMSDKVVLITGASSGMGEATVIRLKNTGYIVYACARRLEKTFAKSVCSKYTPFTIL
jgi:NADP-dependent 3-hydroxy acid dehydrogenase YdfG